jgi:hypothetical protein
MLDNADIFFERLLSLIAALIKDDNLIAGLLYQAERRSNQSQQPGPATRAVWLSTNIDFARIHKRSYYHHHQRDTTRELVRRHLFDLVGTFTNTRNLVLADVLSLASRLGVDVSTDAVSNDENWELSKEQTGQLIRYLKANQLLVECLRLAAVSDRAGIEAQILRLPS